MAHASIKIDVDGWDDALLVQGLSLRQAYNSHHTFEVAALAPQGHELTRRTLEAVLGRRIDLTIALRDDTAEPCRFSGFVDQAVATWTAEGRSVRLLGYSPTVFLDSAPRFRTFGETSLSALVDKVLQPYAGKWAAPVKRGAMGTVDYSIQMQETDYQYLCRLADQFGKLCCYDGQKLFFGDPSAFEPSMDALEWQQRIKRAELALNLAPLHFSLRGYDLEAGAVIDGERAGLPGTAHAVARTAMGCAGIYPAANVFVGHTIDGAGELNACTQRLLARQAYDLVRLTGASNYPGLRLGARFSIDHTDELLTAGDYRIVEISHAVSRDRQYGNTFTAVPTGFAFAPRIHPTRHPVCGPLVAVVRANNDPKKLGRVRVEFLADEERSLSPWLRVLMPYTGHGGWYALPEVGDQVIVQAEDFNMERSPFVAGAFYHGRADAARWFDPQNKKKGFTTEKTTFIIDDRTGKLRIEADEIEFVARRKMALDGGEQLRQQARRIDLNP
jgi:type VI secretion system secreted protein VgrG